MRAMGTSAKMVRKLANKVTDLVGEKLGAKAVGTVQGTAAVSLVAVAESGSVDLAQFQHSLEYTALKALFAEAFLGRQLQAFNKFA